MGKSNTSEYPRLLHRRAQPQDPLMISAILGSTRFSPGVYTEHRVLCIEKDRPALAYDRLGA